MCDILYIINHSIVNYIISIYHVHRKCCCINCIDHQCLATRYMCMRCYLTCILSSHITKTILKETLMELFRSHKPVEFNKKNDWIAPEMLSSNNLTCHAKEMLASTETKILPPNMN